VPPTNVAFKEHDFHSDHTLVFILEPCGDMETSEVFHSNVFKGYRN